MSDPSALQRLAALAEEAGASHLATEARALAARVAEGRFHVACIGQFKRGKSTLLDALVQDAVLPTGVVPVTSVPTVVRYGARRAARVLERDGAWREIAVDDLAAYVSELENPENEKGVAGVEVFVPSPLLEMGLSLVDTPGLGSPHGGNSAATHAFVPHIDAALVVIGTDPPLSGEELELLERVAREVSELVFVLNKADRVTPAERAEAVAFARRVLERRLGRPVGPIHEVSAAERLAGTGPARDWDALVTALDRLARRSGRSLAAEAAVRGLRRLREQLLALLAAERAALLRPVAESERRAAALERTLAAAERSLGDVAHLCAAEGERLARTFAARRADFLREALPPAHAELAAALRLERGRWGPAVRRAAMARAQEVAWERVRPWLEQEQREAEAAYARAVVRFVGLADELLAQLAAGGAPELAALPHALDGGRGFVMRSRFHFNEVMRVARPASPLRHALDAMLGAVGATGPILADAERFLDWLLEMNATRVESDLNARVLESRRRLEGALRALLGEVRAAAAGALARVRAAHEAGAQGVEDALARLARLEAAACDQPSAAAPSWPCER